MYVDLYVVPRELPKNGKVIVHNRVWARWADQMPGFNGFRVWTAPKSHVSHTPKGKLRLQACDCGWSGLPHYRTDAPTEKDSRYGKPPSVKGKRMPAEARAFCESILADPRSPK